MLTVTTVGRALGRGTRDPAQQLAFSLGVWWQMGKGLMLTLVLAGRGGMRASGTMTWLREVSAGSPGCQPSCPSAYL